MSSGIPGIQICQSDIDEDYICVLYYDLWAVPGIQICQSDPGEDRGETKEERGQSQAGPGTQAGNKY